MNHIQVTGLLIVLLIVACSSGDPSIEVTPAAPTPTQTSTPIPVPTTPALTLPTPPANVEPYEDMVTGLAACLWESADSQEPPSYPSSHILEFKFPGGPQEAHTEAKRLKNHFKNQERYSAGLLEIIALSPPETIDEFLLSYHVYCGQKWLGNPTYSASGSDLPAKTAECVWRVAPRTESSNSPCWCAHEP